MGFAALATTSAGFAGTHGRTDGNVTRDEALAHAATIASAVDIPVSADLENGSPTTPTGRETARLAIDRARRVLGRGLNPVARTEW